ncbi:MAG: insulinase family protein [Methanophagales archaeon]|nr:insulinase family protein [Methanophagales archaeon]
MMEKAYLEEPALIFDSIRGFPIVVTEIGIGVNTFKECDGIAIMHLLNNLILKEVSENIHKIGGDIRSMATHEASFFTVTSITRHYQKMIDLIGSTLTNLTFDSGEIDEAKKEILSLNERKNPIIDVYDSFLRIFYQPFLHGRSPIYELNREVICGLGKDKIVEFYNRYYDISNMVIGIVGDVSPESIRDIVKEKFRESKGVPKIKISRNYPKIKFTKPVEIVRHIKGGKCWAVIGYPAPSRTSKDAPVSELITLVMDEVLGREMRSRGWGYVADAMRSDYFDNANIAGFASIYKKEWIEKARQNMIRTFEKLKYEHLSNEELSYYKKIRINMHVISMDTLTTRARGLVVRYLHGLENTDFLDALMNVTPVDLARVAKEYFNGNFISLVIKDD